MIVSSFRSIGVCAAVFLCTALFGCDKKDGTAAPEKVAAAEKADKAEAPQVTCTAYVEKVLTLAEGSEMGAMLKDAAMRKEIQAGFQANCDKNAADMPKYAKEIDCVMKATKAEELDSCGQEFGQKVMSMK